MSRNKKIIITFVVATIVFLIIIGFVWWFNSRLGITQPTVNINEGLQIPEVLPQSATIPTNAPPSLVEEPDLESILKAIAFVFAERFGSYSNQGNFSNLDDLKNLMTIKMKAWADNYQATQRTEASEGLTYYGITSQALSISITSFEESLGRTEVIVSTRRQETKSSTGNPRIFYQDLKLQLVKTGDGWKVDVATWQ